ncbi:DUF6064 family protein [Halochromatium sp.]
MPFSLETYQRLGTLYNARFSLAVLAGVGIGLITLILLRRRSSWRIRLVLASLGLSWLWISWGYQLKTLAPLLWAGELFAIAFALQSGLLLAGAALPLPTPTISNPLWAQSSVTAQGRLGRWIADGMIAFAVLLFPLIELAAGRAGSGLSLFGSAATPTAIGTLGLAAALGPRFALLLMPIPILWCLVASLLEFGLGGPLWLLPSVSVLVSLVAAWLSWQTDAELQRSIDEELD